MKRRIGSWIMALVMVLSMLPATAWAAGETCEGTECAHVAEVAGLHYATLAEAIEVGGTVKLLADVALTETINVDNTVTLDLNGNDITAGGGISPLFNVSGGNLNVTGTGSVTSANKDAFNVCGNSDAATWSNPTNSVLTIGANVTVTAGWNCVWIAGNGAVANVYGDLTSTGEYAVIQGNGTHNATTNHAGTTVNIYDGASVTHESGLAIYHPQDGEINVSGGEITGVDAGIAIKSGTLNVSGTAVIKSTGEDTTPTEGWSNGVNASGAAIQIESNTAYVGGVKLNITGGTISSENGYSIYEYVAAEEQPTAVENISISGGSFTGNVTISEELGNAGLEKFVVTGGNFSGDVSAYTPVAEADGTYYKTLAEAVEAGGTVKLLADVALTETINVDNTVTLDLNGNDITAGGGISPLFNVSDGNLNVTGTGSVTSANKDAFNVCGNSDAATWSNPTNSVLTIGANVTVTAGWNCVWIAGNGAVANVYGDLTSTGEYAVIQGNGTHNATTNHAGTTVNIYDGASVTHESGLAIYHPQDGEINVSGGEITGVDAGIAIKSGTLNVSGTAVIKSTGEPVTPPAGWSDGVNASGAAIQIESNKDYVGNVSVNITGGTITSDKGFSIYEYVVEEDTATTVDNITVSGGTFEGEVIVSEELGTADTQKIVISGGTYDHPVDKNYCADNFVPEDNGDGTYGVTPIIHVTDVTLDRTTLTMDIGGEDTLVATVNPDGATDKTFTWSTSDATVVSVENGTIKALKAGTATITVTTTDGGKTATCVITVTPDPVKYTVTFDGVAVEVTEGSTVAKPAAPVKPGYIFKGWTLNGALYDFATPVTANIDLVSSWQIIPYIPPVVTKPTAPVVVETPDDGAVTVTPKNASKGQTVTVTVKPDEGYELGDLWVTDENGNELVLTDKGSGRYTFIMPDGKVYVDAIFVPELNGLPFTDVKENDWFYDDVAYAYAHGLMDGVSATTFAPSATTTRAMIWTVLARMDGKNVDGGSPWYAKAQSWAMDAAVSDGTAPNGAITREQLAAMLYRFAGSPAVGASELALLDRFADAADVSDWAVEAMAWAVSTGIIDGMNGELQPQGNALRSQTAAMLARFDRYMAE